MARGLDLTWMSADGRLEGDGMHWSRGRDYTRFADVDGDGQQEVLIANNENGAIGILKWSGGQLRPIWIDSDGHLQGVGMHWARGNDSFLAADIDGDGHDEIIITNDDTHTTGVLKWVGGALTPIWINNDGRLPGNGMHWSRDDDSFYAIRTERGPRQDLLIQNGTSGAIGVLRWMAGALTPIYVDPNGISGNPKVMGPVVLDLDGDGVDEVWFGTNAANSIVCKWYGAGLEVIWRDTTGRINGTGIHWSRAPGDQFCRSHVAGGDELLVTNYRDWIGTFRWDGAGVVASAVQPVTEFLKNRQSSPVVFSPLRRSGKNRDDILFGVYDRSTGIIGWDGQRLADVWLAADRCYFGNAGVWDRESGDAYRPFRIEGGVDAILLYSNTRSWTAVLTWHDK